MSSNLLTIDNGFPTFTGKETPQQQIAALHNYLFQLREGLHYSLHNLSRDNFNRTELDAMNDDQKQQMEQLLGNVYARLSEIYSELGSLAGRIGGQDGRIGEITKQMEYANDALEKLGQVLRVAEDGSATIGAEGKRLDLIGEIYINGVLYGQGGIG